MKEVEIPDKVRKYVFDRDGYYCQNDHCVNKFGKYNSLTLHHIVFKSHLGSGHNPCNLITLCWPCHDQIGLLKKFIPGLEVTDESNLIHREQVKFYDHEYSEGDVPCSHRINQKKGITMDDTEKKPGEGDTGESSDSGSAGSEEKSA